ncbi:YcxB family protein [Rheinheimera sp. UJ63]|uniref:YcxB family protein n=1 Tax=Rheinheimera sp. UJ63 TaxID=2910157 RepID=UPI001F301540|nr:YcxB family protein [Rheinheimera sp. UJ63]MCF4009941.1 YcxB family protein [Rheinheimera sp. UJ63]
MEKKPEFGTDGITEINSLGNCFYKWESVESVEDNSGDLYIFLDKLFALIIPAASFSSDTEKAELQSIMKKYV